MNNRIQPIDGLRALSAFGVIWIHSWAYCNNPAMKIEAIDLYQAVAIVGNGVDFFFVISGFCMYLMAGKMKLTIKGYGHFIYKRFLRISPAYYSAVIIYGLFHEEYSADFSFFRELFYHFLFLNNITGNTISGPFWSIATEWHFYLVLPLFLFVAKWISLPRAILIFSICSLLFFCFVNEGFLSYGLWESQILVRFPEFAVGIYAAYIFKHSKPIPKVFNGTKGFIFAAMIMYLGRFMKFTPFLEFSKEYGFFFKSIADTIMVIGFGMLLIKAITQKSAFSRFLSGKVITWLGRISYSIYLWHSLVFILLGRFLIQIKGAPMSVFIVFVLVSIATIFLSHFSYKYLESFYFKREIRKKAILPLSHA